MILNHHAFLLPGLGSHDVSRIQDIFKKSVVSLTGRIVTVTSTMLSVDEARLIIDESLIKQDAETHSYFIIAIDGATREAQNALLKILEEPRDGVFFFLATPRPERLLPTFRSRLYMDSALLSLLGKLATPSDEFLQAPYKKRLAIIAPLIEEGNKAGAFELITNALYSLHITHHTSPTVLSSLDRLRDYITDTSSSLKQILEYSALMIPQVEPHHTRNS